MSTIGALARLVNVRTRYLVLAASLLIVAVVVIIAVVVRQAPGTGIGLGELSESEKAWLADKGEL